MNILLVSIAVYLTVAMILEFLEFNEYIRGTSNRTDESVVSSQLEIFTWPFVLLLFIISCIICGIYFVSFCSEKDMD